MSFRVVRSSKFRHVYGQALKREQCYDNIRVSKSSWDSTFCAVNPKFLAIIVESAGGGAFIVLPHNKVGRIAADHALVGGHKGPVLDIAWCPHNDNVIASGSEDCVVKVWQIPDGGLSRTLTDPVVDLVYHQRRVGLVLWHPSALNVLLTAGSDNLIVIWNVGTGEVLVRMECHPDTIYSACWNWDGSQLVTTCKDKKIRILNPRSGEILNEAIAHEGSKATRAIFLRHGLIFTTGFNRSSERQYSLRAPDALGDPIVMVDLDTSNGVMFPLYDPDTNLIYLCGKGDSVIRYFEVTPEQPFVHYINQFQTPDSQRAVGMMPKRGCDVSTCEVARFYRLNNSGLCQVISMTVPRKSELFQEDLYPDTLSDEASISAEDWISGSDADPQLVSLKDRVFVEKGGYVSQAQSTTLTVTKKSNVLDKMPPRGPKSGGPPTSSSPPAGATTTTSNGSPAANGTSSPASQATSQQQAAPIVVNGASEKELTELRTKFEDEFRKLKAIIVKHENRIRSLEATVKAMADRGTTETDGTLLNTSTPSPTITAAGNQSATPQDDHHGGDGSSHYTNSNLAPDEV
ncbi:coronin-6 isoform X1 [Culex quinquefasciatus]|uniref:coronin-6 isoform X1 n=1 Tax=Culex quinquefasciatus TaxID=7176 RepID=UPI0018E2E69D|nr:coronin-6 isoform X1 [Culex quinquefasciatus]XP_038119086.1 coronin-6 isoform X1 [Culex quinquefasciatus]XP_038119087.1 coronin-6 isoform X1 [Culex quinquefasciatus]XP_038119088.1 coronin-6 isoform X1 [Culex quinquefasciatus]XP_039450692.1 coronin-6 isoform X1 [Culex pipiens pallens]XP_039450693.1 coronin-6 isoform X1 [Culex pipiens pallens]XP_039450694.1 coronin-6 isoform X1 [Culex pipiens pallens]XP_039450695.1 coronin-6 isoform X1 [Culex pipiens pallens]